MVASVHMSGSLVHNPLQDDVRAECCTGLGVVAVGRSEIDPFYYSTCPFDSPRNSAHQKPYAAEEEDLQDMVHLAMELRLENIAEVMLEEGARLPGHQQGEAQGVAAAGLECPHHPGDS